MRPNACPSSPAARRARGASPPSGPPIFQAGGLGLGLPVLRRPFPGRARRGRPGPRRALARDRPPAGARPAAGVVGESRRGRIRGEPGYRPLAPGFFRGAGREAHETMREGLLRLAGASR